MSLPPLFGSSPPVLHNNYYGVEELASLDLDEDITPEEIDEDIEDQKARIDQAFHYMKQEVQKEMEGALAPKTISDYARYVVVFSPPSVALSLLLVPTESLLTSYGII